MKFEFKLEQFFIKGNACENVVCKMVSVFFTSDCVKGHMRSTNKSTIISNFFTSVLPVTQVIKAYTMTHLTFLLISLVLINQISCMKFHHDKIWEVQTVRGVEVVFLLFPTVIYNLLLTLCLCGCDYIFFFKFVKIVCLKIY